MAIASKHDVSPEEIARAAGTTLEALRDPEGYVAASVWRKVLEELETRTGDPWVGMHSAEVIQLGTYGVIDYVVTSSPSLLEAFRAFARYFAVLNVDTRMMLEECDRGLWLERRNQTDFPMPRHAAEFGLATTFLRFSRYTSQPWDPLAVELRSPLPGDDSEYRRIFRAPVAFEKDRDAFFVPKEFLERPMAHPDAALHELMENHGRWLLDRLPKERPFIAEAADKLRGLLSKGEATVMSLAHALHVSERTLQRRLSDEGSSFRDLLDQVRADLARRYLSSPEMTIGEVAYLLGYSETATFHRAFRQWTGQTPGSFRSSHAHPRALEH